jgi:hypothetical protein
MAITYPLTLPTTGISSVEFRTVNANATSQSPFTFKQQVISHGGQQLSATVNLAPMRRAKASVWKAALISLKGSLGTFLLSDPNYCFPRGTLRSTSAQQFASVSGNAGETFFTMTMTNQSDTLRAGDYIQVGLESGARLYQVLEDRTGNGTVEVFPNLRTNYVDELVGTNDPKGVFRLSNNVTSWSIDNASVYGISFDCVEAITG